MPEPALLLERHQPPQTICDTYHPGVETYDYTDAYQPHYPDPDALLDAVHELHETEPVVRQAERIVAYKQRLARMAKGVGCLILTGRCNEPVDARMSIDTLADEATTDMQAVEDGLRDAGIDEQTIDESENDRRGMGQGAKPRSKGKQRLDGGGDVTSYMGDMINGSSVSDRTPDPSRMVAAAVQARDLRAKLEQRTEQEIIAASEALLLPYASSFVFINPEDGKKYLLSSHLPWLGERTNKRPPEGKVNHHVELLSQVENPVGVKLGSKSDAAHIEWLASRLNPTNAEGKLIFMIRVGSDRDAMERILDGVRRHASNAIIMYDIHGSTVTDEDGTKIRAVDKIIADIETLGEACRDKGLRLRGLHLETSGDESTQECVDELYVDGELQRPEQKPAVDPLLNPMQLRKIVGSVAMRLV